MDRARDRGRPAAACGSCCSGRCGRSRPPTGGRSIHMLLFVPPRHRGELPAPAGACAGSTTRRARSCARPSSCRLPRERPRSRGERPRRPPGRRAAQGRQPRRGPVRAADPPRPRDRDLPVRGRLDRGSRRHHASAARRAASIPTSCGRSRIWSRRCPGPRSRPGRTGRSSAAVIAAAAGARPRSCASAPRPAERPSVVGVGVGLRIGVGVAAVGASSARLITIRSGSTVTDRAVSPPSARRRRVVLTAGSSQRP